MGTFLERDGDGNFAIRAWRMRRLQGIKQPSYYRESAAEKERPDQVISALRFGDAIAHKTGECHETQDCQQSE
jgi:hypothetical protein